MNYKCVNDLDKFDFKEARVLELMLSDDGLILELTGGIAKYNNPCNTKYIDCFIGETRIRMKDVNIRRMFLEGAKYYSADDVLLREVPDEDIPESSWKDVFNRMTSGEVYMISEIASNEDGTRVCEMAVDVEDDTYWMEAYYSRIIIEWDRFMNPVGEE